MEVIGRSKQDARAESRVWKREACPWGTATEKM